MARYAIELKEFRRLRKSLHLTRTQKAALVGSILGDGWLELSKNHLEARLQIRNSRKYADYVEWKYRFFQDWSPRGVVNDSANNSVYFKTLFHRELGLWHKQFYRNGRKIVPREINSILTSPLSLAVWMMDDGNGYLRSSALRISSYCFTEQENTLLKQCLEKNCGIATTLYHDSKGYHMYIPAKSAKKWYQLTQAYIHPSMAYKLTRLNPVETTRKLPPWVAG